MEFLACKALFSRQTQGISLCTQGINAGSYGLSLSNVNLL